MQRQELTSVTVECGSNVVIAFFFFWLWLFEFHFVRTLAPWKVCLLCFSFLV